MTIVDDFSADYNSQKLQKIIASIDQQQSIKDRNSDYAFDGAELETSDPLNHFKKIATDLLKLYKELEDSKIKKTNANIKAKTNFKNPEDLLTISLLDMDKLPKNILSDIKKNSLYEFVKQLIEIFKFVKRPIHIGEMQIALYKMHGQDLKKSLISNRLHRVCQQEKSIRKVKGKKGYYEFAPN